MNSRSEMIIGKKGIKDKVIAIIGIGGLGSTTSELLARMHPKKLILIDFDRVEEVNLERQILYDKNDIAKSKVVCAKEKLQQFCDIEIRSEKLGKENINFQDIDLLIDCTDNVDVRLIINKYCRENKIPWIYSAAIQQIGSVFFVHPEGPCYECFNQHKQGEKCAEVGVLNSTVSLVASLTVNIAIEYLVFNSYPKELFRLNLETYSFDKIKVNKNPSCRVCSILNK
jgi:molybdopterin/thiamine biosynthesis adenylyltransferase